MASARDILSRAWSRARAAQPRTLALVALGAVAAIWIAPMVVAAIARIDLADIGHPYLVITAFVILDAVVPVFPSESLLTAGSTAIAAGATDMRLGPLILAGCIGAVLGDSLLFGLSRTFARPSLTRRVERAQQDERAAAAMRVLGRRAGLLITAGRFVPGLRFIVNVTMGIGEIPYLRFLPWAALGGFLWSLYTCVVTFAIGQALGAYPVLSFLVSVAVTGAILVLVARPLMRQYAEERRTGTAGGPAPGSPAEAVHTAGSRRPSAGNR